MLAEHQLDCAIRLLLDHNDPISAITLAGAAEEILGKLVAIQGGKHSLGSFVDQCIQGGRQLVENWSAKDFVEIANFYRDELKHYREGADVVISPECAHGIIDRAAENRWLLVGYQSEQVRRYMDQVHGI
ncbi:MAG: hypothetical protein ACKO1K_07475 [Burkholderiales bacterium]